MSEVIAPHGLSLDRDALWNMAESSERRSDGRTAREWVIALPAELDEAARTACAREFSRWLSDRYQVAADLAIHEPGRHGDSRNHHAHILLTTRRLTVDGQLAAKADIELDGSKLKALGLPTSKAMIKEARQAWERIANRSLERAGVLERIDHRSHEDRGLDAATTLHLGPSASEMERRGRKTRIGSTNRAVADFNKRQRAVHVAAAELQHRAEIEMQAIDPHQLRVDVAEGRREETPEMTVEREAIERSESDIGMTWLEEYDINSPPISVPVLEKTRLADRARDLLNHIRDWWSRRLWPERYLSHDDDHDDDHGHRI